jgi:hypothetical protein
LQNNYFYECKEIYCGKLSCKLFGSHLKTYRKAARGLVVDHFVAM